MKNFNSQNNNSTVVQSAGNLSGSSETIRQLSSFKNHNRSSDITGSWFNAWFAGVIDGDGNFDLRKLNKTIVLKAIRIKVHVRDVRILTTIQNMLHFGRIRYDKKNPYCTYIVSTQEHMRTIINLINGLIRLKVDSFKKSCIFLNIVFKPADYTLKGLDPYFAGLIDSDGTIVFNYKGNRIECVLEFKLNEFSKQLNLDFVVPNYPPSVYHVRNGAIAFKYQRVNQMIFLYEYFMKNRLFCTMKFYRISKIKYFLTIRHYQKYPKHSLEFRIYSSFLVDFIKYQNPKWPRVPFVKNLIIDKEIVQNDTQ
uniref:Homing endonuclease LAGLIDADG domain-containing protein n=1 Tax=Ulva compressa TaxID=63659 RepID=A0A3S6P7I7_ULVCO|nr:hypothetical protein [Ulva compressa]ATP01497.1 hypothetical protein [Ulva compressa]AZT79238.1 hypothetical protein [Ulva compressa]